MGREQNESALAGGGFNRRIASGQAYSNNERVRLFASGPCSRRNYYGHRPTSQARAVQEEGAMHRAPCDRSSELARAESAPEGIEQKTE